MAKRKTKPIVAVVGRPNVGKSTLFNVLAGENISIVKDTPGITRDRIYADVTWLDMAFTLIDTGGIEPDSNDIILSQMRQQAEIAMETADVIIFLVDVKQGLVDADSKVADMLRRSRKPVVLVVNKVDSFEFPGLSGMDKMAGIMNGLRQNPPTEIGGYTVVKVTDYKKPEETGLPASDVLIYSLEGGATVVVRPSGTEPKIKTYFTTLGKDLAEAEAQKEKLADALKPIFA